MEQSSTKMKKVCTILLAVLFVASLTAVAASAHGNGCSGDCGCDCGCDCGYGCNCGCETFIDTFIDIFIDCLPCHENCTSENCTS
jgi:hypothetical protein